MRLPNSPVPVRTTGKLPIAIAVRHLRRGGLLIYPTETAYAIGCDATNPAAVRAIFRSKGRDRGKPLPLIVASTAMAERYARFTPLARRLARRHWPGPLTLVLRSKVVGKRLQVVKHLNRATPNHLLPVTSHLLPALAPGITAPDGTIALRISSHPIARALAAGLGRPIVSTSANRSGQPPAFSVRTALRSLHTLSKAKLWTVDLGVLPRRRPSTIVDCTDDRAVVLRQGSVCV